jgi:hypothetical protein
VSGRLGVVECMDGWVGGWVIGSVSEWVGGWVCVNVRMGGWVTE